MNQRIRFLEVLIKYAVTFYVDVNIYAYFFLKSCVIIARCSGCGDLEALGNFNRRAYISVVFKLCPDILCDSLDCSNIFVCLHAVTAVKDVTF